MQAQSSQAIPLDDILDSAGKSFVQNLFGIPKKPADSEHKSTTDASHNPDTQKQESENIIDIPATTNK
jgi:hypothetical protein